MDYREQFGQFVKALRREQFLYTVSGPQQWTQEDLARQVQLSSHNRGLSAKQISDIERGEVAHLKREIHIEPLARAFNLNEAQKKEFYAAAGYVFQAEAVYVPYGAIRLLLEQHHYPAYARNPVWDLVAFNPYVTRLFCHNPDALSRIRNGPLAPNLLWVLFDPEFEQKRLYPPSGWEEAMLRAIQRFRTVSFPFIQTHRYRFILNGMQQYPEFQRLWRLSETSVAPRSDRWPSVNTIQHPEFGELAFVSSQISSAYLEGNDEVKVTVYVPLATSETSFSQFQETVKEEGGEVSFFQPPPLTK